MVNNTSVTVSTSSWSAGIGYAIFLNDHVAIEPAVGYVSKIGKYKDSDERDIVSSITASVGFQIYLGKRD